MIQAYQGSYRGVVSVAAKRIIALAEESPIRPSEVPDIDQMKSPFTSDPHLSVFDIETVAPTVSTVVAEQDARGCCERCFVWRPLPQQELPLAEYSRPACGRLDFKGYVSGV